LKIDAELGDLQKTLNTAKASLSSFMASGSAPKGLEKAFEKINSLLGQLSDKTSKPLDLKGLNSAGKDLNNVQETIHSLVRLLGDFNDLSDDAKISFLPPDEQKKIKATIEALKKYEQAVVNITKKTKELDAARNAADKKGAAASRAKSNVDSLTGSRSIKQAKLEGERGKLAAINVEGGNPEKIAKYEASIKSIQAEIADLDRQIQEANNTLTQSQSEYDASANAVTQLETEIKKANKGALKELKD
jgi:chromosome segregation ATPase